MLYEITIRSAQYPCKEQDIGSVRSKNLLGLSTNPIPIKAAMAMLDMASDELRLPMTPLSDSKAKILEKALTDYGLLV